MVFVRYVVEGTLLPKVLIKADWLEPQDFQVLLGDTDATSILAQYPTKTNVPDTMRTGEQEILSLVLLSPFKLVYLLPKPPFLAPPSTYALIEEIVAVLKLEVAVQLLLRWLRGRPQDAVPVVYSLGDLDTD